MSRWVTLQKPWIVPSKPGVYAVYGDGELIYIGQSSDLRERLRRHNIRPSYGRGTHSPWGDFDSMHVKVRVGGKFGEWAMVEIRLIHRIRPRFNVSGLGRRASKAVAHA